MAPTTRLSGAYGGSNAVPNLEHILEHFDQFKRKHITQNRDIIKTNALAQLRIRELEAKVQALEAERAAQSVKMLRLRAALNRIERAADLMTRGWQEMGKGLVTVTHAEGQLDAANSQAAYARLAQASITVAMPLYATVNQGGGARISIDPSVLPAGVVRSIARAPEVQILDVPEEEDEATSSYVVSERDPDFTIRESGTPSWSDEQGTASSLLRFNGLEATRSSNMPEPNLLDADGAPSPLPSPSLDANGAGVFAFLEHGRSLPPSTAQAPPTASHMQSSRSKLAKNKEQASRINSSSESSSASTSRSTSVRNSQTVRLLKARRSGRPQVSRDSSAAPGSSTAEEVTDSEPECHLSRARSTDSLSSYVDEEIQVSDDDDTYVERSSTLRNDRNGTLTMLDPTKELDSEAPALWNASTPVASVKNITGQANTVLDDVSSSKVNSTGSNRKRKVPVSPIEASRTSSTRARASANESTDLPSAEVDSSSSRSRRTSTRARSSVNYALPKLNTKMRKPDPVDLIPVAINTTSSSPAAVAIGDVADAATSSISPQEPRRGITGAASTGNLNDIRRQHQTAAAEREASAAREVEEDDEDTPDRRKEVDASELSALEADSGTEVERISTPALRQGPWRRTSVISCVVPRQDKSDSGATELLPRQEASSATGIGRIVDGGTGKSIRPSAPASAQLTLQDLGFSEEELDPLPARPRLQSAASKVNGMVSRPRSASCESSLVSLGSAKAAKSRSGSGAALTQPHYERPRTYSGASSKALASSVQGNGVLSLGRATASIEGKQRTNLHAALTANNGQGGIRRMAQSAKATDSSNAGQPGRREGQ